MPTLAHSNDSEKKIVQSSLASLQNIKYNKHKTVLAYYQVICVLYMRDSLLMSITTILVHSDKLKTWQLAKLPKCESQGWYISRLFGYNNYTHMKTY